MARIVALSSVLIMIGADRIARGDEPLSTPADAYEAITRDYAASMKAATEAGAVHATLRAIGKRRSEAFAELVESARATDCEQLTAADLAALSMACEYLRRRDDCIHYGELAIARDPTVVSAYRPLIRSLLNARQLDRAAAVLRNAEKHIPDPVSWGAMHYLLYIRYARNENWQPALSHLVVHNSRMASVLETNNDAVLALRRSLKDFCEAHGKAGAQSACAIHLQDYYSQTSAAIAHLNAELPSGQLNSLERAQLLCSLWEVRCEVARLLGDESFEGDVRGWLGRLLSEHSDCSSQAMLELRLTSFIEFVFEHSDAIHEWQHIEAMLETTATADCDGTADRDHPVAMLKFQLRQLAAGEARAQQILNTEIPPLDEASRIHDESAVIEEQHGQPLAVLLTTDAADLEPLYARFVDYWLNELADVDVDRIWICAASSSEPESAGELAASQRNARERLSAVMARHQVDCTCGIVSSDSELWKYFGENSLPRIVLVDGARRVRMVVQGASPDKVQRLREELGRIDR